ncbi:unnamed protein product [Mesocestoides corti]|uniref:UDP-sugar transporter protein SLC35A4 n=1 Tax=Mesocestoides corti TaxID=53468 RepID=A0A0R3UIY7_MESCO|nr:unnamed protein product [Mesocestoides corti]
MDKDLSNGVTRATLRMQPWRESDLNVLLYSSYTILIHLCEVDGHVPFSYSAVVLAIEILKLLLSIGMFLIEIRREQKQSDVSGPYFDCLGNRLRREFGASESAPHSSTMDIKLVVLPFAIPAILYTITNNLGIAIQMEMDPATYQVLGNFKVLSTAILFRLIIQRLTNFDSNANTSSSVLHITLKGIFMISIYCTVSGLASVYTEYVLKRRVNMSLNVQNATLYVFGIVVNGLLYVFQEGLNKGTFNIFLGFSVYTWILVVTQAISGIFMGFVMKYANNILRLFIISSAMVVTTILSILIFNLVVKTSFLISASTVVAALFLYNM